MRTFRVREFVDEDLGGVARLWRDSWASTGLRDGDDLGLEQFEHRLSTEGRQTWSIQVAVVENDLLGFMACQKEPKWLRQLFVAPTMKRLGIGTLLLDRAKRHMPDGFWLRTNVDNDAARRFYEMRGRRLDVEVLHPTSGHRMAQYLWTPMHRN